MEVDKYSEKKVEKQNEFKKKKLNTSLNNGQLLQGQQSDTNKYLHKLWNIKLSDLDSEDKYLNQKCYNFKLDAKFFRFSGFSCFSETALMFSKKKGLEIKSLEADNQISMVISSDDIMYCVCAFHDPVYLLFIKIGECVANAFYNELKNLNSFDQKFKANLINLTRIIVFIKTTENEIGMVSTNLKKFFQSISKNYEKPKRLDFLNIKKSKELVASEFENDQEVLKEIYQFIS